MQYLINTLNHPCCLICFLANTGLLNERILTNLVKVSCMGENTVVKFVCLFVFVGFLWGFVYCATLKELQVSFGLRSKFAVKRSLFSFLKHWKRNNEVCCWNIYRQNSRFANRHVFTVQTAAKCDCLLPLCSSCKDRIT